MHATDRMDTNSLDQTLARLTNRAADWHRLTPRERARPLRACIAGILAESAAWVEVCCRAKGIDPASTLAGEEWLAGPMTTIRGFRLVAETLETLDGPERVRVSAGPGGRSVAHVFPGSLLERVLYLGMRGEVWFPPGSPATRAAAYRAAARQPDTGVALVLGAGNVSSIGPLDALSMLVAHDQVTLLKLNPVTDYLQPVFERAFAPLIERGYLAIAKGDGRVGEYLCHHAAVSRLHLTGSRRTYDAIVWGGDPAEQRSRKAEGTPRLTKPCSAELGCVTPILVVPGPWSEADLDFQARHVAAMVTHNASFNCVAGKALVVARGWPQRDAFLGRVADALARTPARLAYYPGAEARYAAFLGRYPQARRVGAPGPGVVPWTVIPEVPPRAGEYALEEEAFCGVLAEVTIEADDPVSFLAEAVRMANDHIEGTLSAVVLVHPATAREAAGAVEQAVADLRYGSVGVNVWSGVVFGIGSTTWGAFPGHTPADIGSGVGVVHNAWLFDHPEKSVVRAPFRLWPTPVWFADHRTLRDVGRLMTALEAAPSWLKLPGVLLRAVRG